MSQLSSRHCLVALACAASLLFGAAPSAYAATSTPSRAAEGQVVQDSPMHQAGQALAQPAPKTASTASTATTAASPLQPSAGTLHRQVFGFAQASNMGDPTAGYPSWDFALLSTVAFFGLHVNNDGTLANDSGMTYWNSQTLVNMVSAAHAAGTRVVLTLIKQDLTSGMCTALQNGATTVAQAVAQVNAKGVDGINVDYEGSATTCSSSTNYFVTFVQQLRAALGAGRNLTVDTYGASAAPGGDGFFNLGGMAPSVDAFFVMAYGGSNWSGYGSCCLSPAAPFSTYFWNGQKVASQYVQAGLASKTILGFPYYGYAACVSSTAANAQITGSLTAPTPLSVQGMNLGPRYNDALDGIDHWYAGYPNSWNCTRELYLDDGDSLGVKYQIVNNYGLQGAGIWALDMGGGIASLWNALAVNFSYTPGAPTGVTACPGNGFATVRWNAPPSGAGPITSYSVAGSPAGSATASGRASQVVVGGLTNGTAYSFRAQAANGYGAGPLSDPSNSVTPAPPLGTWPANVEPVTPSRILDTRTGGGTLAPNSTASLNVLGRAGVPANPAQVDAVVLNLTATNATAAGYLTAYAQGTCFPGSSNLNFGPGQQVAALVETSVDAGGNISIYNGSGASSVDVIADIVGWVAAPGFGAPDVRYRPTAGPARVLDTRTANNAGHPGPLGPNQTLNLPFASAPAGAVGVVVNLTATDTSAPGYLTAFPTGQAMGTSSVNYGPGDAVANLAVVKLGSGQSISIYNGSGYSSASVIVDLVGYLVPDGNPNGQLTGLTPVRIVDTRDGTGGVSGPVAGGSWITVAIAGAPGLPAGTVPSAVVLTLTGTNATANSYLYVDPTGATVAGSDLNFFAGQTRANLVTTKVGSDGKIHIYNSQGQADVIVDLLGWVS